MKIIVATILGLLFILPTYAADVDRQSFKEERQRINQQRQEQMAELRKKSEEFKASLSQKRNEVKDIYKQNKEELRAKLTEIKDTKKREAVERINDNIAKVNSLAIIRFEKALGLLDSAIQKVTDKTNKAGDSGKDVSSVLTAIEKARISINSARLAVSEQAGKVYTITITNENGLGKDVSRVRQELHTDLSLVKDKIHEANKEIKLSLNSLRLVIDPKSIEPKTKDVDAITNSSNDDSSEDE